MDGIEVSQSRKSLLTESSISSQIRSNSDIQEIAKWQFYKRTHPPLLLASLIIFSALGPYPYPKEI